MAQGMDVETMESMPDGWDDWLRMVRLATDETEAILTALMASGERSSSVPAAHAAHFVLDRIGRRVAFATRSLRPFAERHRIYTEHPPGG